MKEPDLTKAAEKYLEQYGEPLFPTQTEEHRLGARPLDVACEQARVARRHRRSFTLRKARVDGESDVFQRDGPLLGSRAAYPQKMPRRD